MEHKGDFYSARPSVVVLGGPNGAGKTTISRATLADTLGLGEFVNADAIARGLSAFEPEKLAMQAGRVMLNRLRELASRRASFAFESTLSTRTFAPWLRRLVAEGLWCTSCTRGSIHRLSPFGGSGSGSSKAVTRYQPR